MLESLGEKEFRTIAFLLVALISIPVFWFFVPGLSRQTQAGVDGFVPVKPSILLRMLGLFGLVAGGVAIAGAGWVILSVRNWVLLPLGVAGCLFLAFVLISAFHRYVCLQIKYNDDGVRWRKLGASNFWYWTEIGGTGYNGRVGVYFVRNGEELHIPDIFRGYWQLMTMAKDQGVPLHPYLKSQLESRS
ncbi:hypothetical protein [Parvularcula marina]|uniref:Uncharacterized protein n=1 Tax=Parvularcula marina TaxID=2292771 RepID=A0A371RGJ9_9PROT|nr:hypothetical protein [Parvularcula marina]RFB04578.1 hypothetical protein DX908_04355 [Parvularcula marina]